MTHSSPGTQSRFTAHFSSADSIYTKALKVVVLVYAQGANLVWTSETMSHQLISVEEGLVEKMRSSERICSAKRTGDPAMNNCCYQEQYHVCFNVWVRHDKALSFLHFVLVLQHKQLAEKLDSGICCTHQEMHLIPLCLSSAVFHRHSCY